MKRFIWTTFAAGIMLAMILTACGISPTAPTATENPAAPKINDSSFSAGDVIASAVVVPAQQAQMSFVISAPVKEILVKEGDIVKAGQALILLSTLDLELSVIEAELAVRSAQLQVERSNDPYKKIRDNGKVTYVKGYVEKRQELESKLQAAQASLETAKSTLAQGTLIASFDSAVVDVIIEAGEIAQSGKVVIVLGDVANMQIETTDLSERDVPNVSIGQAVTIYIEALDTTVNGKVTSVSPISNIVGGDVIYKVKVAMDEQPAGLLWGMSAEVHIQTAP
ncbi:MAG: HlyD family efflux transporter periplasmic adaptor subunit [Anaerolineales bacterium]|nr:HlyD family efflux transporter periplasmic adaptor subunit [Anaerolineales bacterium]